MPRAAHPRTQSLLRVPSSRRRLVGALPQGFSSVPASLLPHVARWLCSAVGWASTVRHVPGERDVLCCGCSKGPRLVFGLLRSNVASHALSKTQPALNSAGTGARRRESQERGRELRWGFLTFFILQFKGKTHSRRPNSSGAVSLPCKCTFFSGKHKEVLPLWLLSVVTF